MSPQSVLIDSELKGKTDVCLSCLWNEFDFTALLLSLYSNNAAKYLRLCILCRKKLTYPGENDSGEDGGDSDEEIENAHRVVKNKYRYVILLGCIALQYTGEILFLPMFSLVIY